MSIRRTLVSVINLYLEGVVYTLMSLKLLSLLLLPYSRLRIILRLITQVLDFSWLHQRDEWFNTILGDTRTTAMSLIRRIKRS